MDLNSLHGNSVPNSLENPLLSTSSSSNLSTSLNNQGVSPGSTSTIEVTKASSAPPSSFLTDIQANPQAGIPKSSEFLFLNANLPDLVAQFGERAKNGQEQIIITNQGNQTAQGNIDITFYRSTDPFLDKTDTLLTVLKKQVISLAVGESQTYNTKITLPKDLANQNYYLIAVVDSQNAIKEIDKGNNLATLNATALPTDQNSLGNSFSTSARNGPNTTLQKAIFWNNPVTGENRLWYTGDSTWFKGNIDNSNSVTGIFEALPTQTDLNWKFQTTGDIDGDGQTDIVWKNSVTGAIQAWIMDGTSRTQTVDIGVPILDPSWRIQGAGDFDQDGRDDLVWRNYSTGVSGGLNVIWALQLNPVTGKYDFKAGTGTSYFLTLNDPTWEIQGVGDFNADLKPDLIWRNTVTGVNAIWLLNGGNFLTSSPFSADYIPTANYREWQIRGSSDFNGDGKSDLLWQNTLTGESSAWYIDGTRILGNNPANTAAWASWLTKIPVPSSWQSYGSYKFYETNPIVTAGLTTDTAIGGTNTDLITSNPTISGQVSGPRISNVLKARFGTTQAFTTITTSLPANGQFTLSRSQLQQLNGGIALADGTYTLQLQAQDMHLNLSSITSLTFKLDTQAPTLGGPVKLTSASDTGFSNTDNITNQAKPTIAGTSEVQALVTLREGTVVLGTAIADSVGAWQITPTNPFTAGNHTLTAIAVDVAGNASLPSTLLVQVDFAAPTLTLTSNLANATLSATSRLTGTLSDLGAGAGALKYRFGTGSEVIVPVGTNGTFDQAINFKGAPTGATTLVVTGMDVAGNLTSTTYNVTVSPDTQAPTINASLDTSILNQPKIIAQVTDDRSVQGLQARLNGQTVFSTIALDASTGNYIIDLKQLNGGQTLSLATAYTVDLKATDSSNNISAPKSVQVYLTDPNQAINISILNPTGGTGNNGQLQLPAPNDPNGPKNLDGTSYTGPVFIQQTPDGKITIDIGNAICKTFQYVPSNAPLPPNSSQGRPADRYDYKLYLLGGSGGAVAIGGGNFDGNNQLVMKELPTPAVSPGLTGGGLKTGTYLLVPDYVPVKPLSEINANPDENCVACRARKQFNADASVELHSGGVFKSESLVSYQSKDQTQSLGLSYSSLRADARPIVHFGYDNIGSNIKDTYRMTGLLTVKTSGADVVSTGYTTDLGIMGAKVGENYWKLPPQGGALKGALQVDMRGQPSGVYDYEINTGIKVLCGCMAIVGDSTILRDKLVVVNGADSDFGTGWGLTGIQKIYETTTRNSNNNQLEYNALVVDGSGNYVVFRSTDGTNYASANGEFSVLSKQNGTFTRITQTGTVYAFNSDNKLISTTDRNGQVTQVVYDATTKRLVKMIDSANLETTFNYGSQTGKVEQMTDPGGRVTRLLYEAYTLNGQTLYKLKSIQDPDTFTRSFGYTASANPALLTSDQDKRANISTFIYDALTGRATQATDKDSLAVTKVSPAQIQGVSAASLTKDPNSATLPTAIVPELTQNPLRFSSETVQAAIAGYTDAAQTAAQHTGSSTIYLNRAQEEIYAKDEFGNSDVIERNNSTNLGQYLPSKVTDARGQQTSYTYDQNGNVTQVSDLLTNGTPAPGAFFPGAILPSPSYWQDSVFADWDGDNKVDLISSSYEGVTVAYGNGKGLFSAPVKLASSGEEIIVEDLNQDGRPDLVVAGSNSSGAANIKIYLSNPTDQTLLSPQEFLIPQVSNNSYVTHLLLADLNGDNSPDIVAMGLGYNSEKWQMTLKNNGVGVFQDPANGVRQNPLGLAASDAYGESVGNAPLLVGDINGDNRQDLVLITSKPNTTNPGTYKTYTLLGQANGGVIAGTTLGMPTNYGDTTAIGHFTSATSNDLLIGNSYNSTVQIFAGNGTGGFAAPTTQTLTGSFFTDSLRDIDGDGIIDAMTQTYDSTKGYQFSVNYGAGNNTFRPSQTYSTYSKYNYVTNSPEVTPLAWGDLDGNGQIDLLLRTPSAVSSLQQQTDHSFIVQSNASSPAVNPASFSFGNTPIKTIVGEVNGDWVPDLIALTSTGLSVQMGYGDETYAMPLVVSLSGANQTIAAGDLNGDGAQDIVVANAAGTLTIVMSDGKGKFLSPQASAVAVGGNPTDLALRDLNGDGFLDLVSTNGTGNTVSVLFGTGTGNFTNGATYVVGSNPKALAIGDVNGDGKLDIAVANAGNNSVSLLMNTGAGGFALATTYTVTSSPTSIAIGDVNGDGTRDIVVGTNATTDNLWVFNGQAGAVPQPIAQKYTFGDQGLTAVALADLDGDGKLDIVTTGNAGYYYSPIYVQLGGTTTLSPKQRFQFSNFGNSGMLALADLDLDGAVDILTVGQTNALVYLNDRLRVTLPKSQGRQVTEYDTKFDPTTGLFSGTYTKRFNQVTRTIDELGRQTIYQLDEATGRVTRSIRVMGTIDSATELNNRTGDDVVTEYSYTTDGRVFEMRDAMNRVTRYDYAVDATNVGGNVRRMYSAYDGTVDQAMVAYEYDNVGNQIASIDEYGNRTTYTYKLGTNLMATMTGADPDGAGPLLAPITSYLYDQNGNQIQVTGPDPDGTGPRSAAVSTSLYDNMNRLTQTTGADPDGTGPLTAATTTYEYDLNGNQTATVDALGRRTETVYDSRNRFTGSVRKNAAGVVLNQFSSLYDGTNNATGSIDANGKRTNTVYDKRGRRTREIDALGNVTRFIYDAANQLAAQVDAKGNMTRFIYDDLGRRIKVIDANGNSSQTVYDLNGNVIARIDTNGNRTESRYDNRDRLIRSYDANNTIVPEAARKFTETKYGRVTIGGKVYAQTQIIDPNVNATTYVYDGLGRLSTDTNQLGKTRTYKYDAIGNQLEIIDRNGINRTFEYDVLNRQTKENWLSAGTVTRSFTSQYDVLNQLIDVTDQSIAGGVGTKLSQYGYSYDDLDRLKTIDNLGIGGVARVLLTYGYDPNGNIKSVTDTIAGTLSGTTVYDYDALNRATQITQSGVGITNKRVTMTYNAVGQMETLQRFTGTQSVATSTYSYSDPLNRLTQIQHANATGTTFSSFAFTYDNGSRIKKITNADGTFVNYDYANNDELKGADYSPTNRIDEAYTYDANGNRTNAGYVTGGNNQLSADAKYDYTYDDEGNLKTRRDRSTNLTRTFTWDYRNRLVGVVEGGVSIAAYSYDAGNQRISKTTGVVTTRYVYDRNHVALEFTEAATVPNIRYFYGTGVDQILAQDKGSGNVSWQLTDQLGSVRSLVGNDGVVRNRFEYDAFGNVVSTMVGATDDSRYRYTGREFDAETGLNYYRARYFDSFSGRFIGQDPIGFNAGDSNLYRYVGNHPINNVDPSGLDSSCPSPPQIPHAPPSFSISRNIEAARARPLNVWWFRDQVQNGGPWDYKQLDPATEDRPSPYESIGNFNYGATGRALGIPAGILEREAGRAQIAAETSRPEFGQPGDRKDYLSGKSGWGTYGDDPNDNYWIRKGIEYYDSSNNICHEIEKITNPKSWNWSIPLF